MCGIVVCPAKCVTQVTRESIKRCLLKRGKDQFNSVIVDGYEVFHSRLHLFGELNSGIQPYSVNEITIVFNGEIYNTEGQGELDKIYKSYIEYGDRFGNYLQGQYSIVILDQKKLQILIARDEYGQKPLFYHREFKWIASTLDTHFELFDTSINNRAIKEFLIFGHRVKESSFMEGVEELKPGHTVCLDFEMNLNGVHRNKFEYSQRLVLEDRLESAVRNRLAGSHYHFATLLSGGIDSFLVTYFAKKLDKLGKLKAFTSSVSGSRDESERAKLSACKLDVTLEVTQLSDDKILSFMQNNLYDIFDEPISDPSALLVSLQMKGIDDRYRMILSGDGADEIFRGYNRYRIKSILYLFYVLRVNKLLRFIFKKPFIKEELVQNNFNDAFLLWTSKLEVKNIGNIFQEKFTRQELNMWDVLYYLPNNINIKLDRPSLYFNKEIRSPFLAVEFQKYLHSKFGWDFRFRKRPLRKLSKRLGHVNHSKTGYSFSWNDLVQKFDIDNIIIDLSDRYIIVQELLKETIPNDALKWRLIHLYLWSKKRF